MEFGELYILRKIYCLHYLTLVGEQFAEDALSEPRTTTQSASSTLRLFVTFEKHFISFSVHLTEL